MFLILMVAEMMVQIMTETMSMEIKMLHGPICANVLQILGMTIPKPRFRTGADQLLLQETMESYTPEAAI